VNNKGLLLALLLIPATWICFGQVPRGYYANSFGLNRFELKNALHIRIHDHDRVPWDSSFRDSWTVLYESDKDPQNPENILLIYSGSSVEAKDNLNHHSWEREHVWAKIHGDFGKMIIPATDLHNIKPSDETLNGSSGKWYKDFDNGGNSHFNNDIQYQTDKDSFEPRDEDKGDVARILFYMDVRYEGGDNELDLILTDEVNTVVKTDSAKIGYFGKLSTLLEWNHLDPVDEFERHRNDVICKYQGNRNPFIDHPEYADFIWGKNNIITRPGSLLVLYPVPASDVLHILWDGKSPARAMLLNSGGVTEMEIEFSGSAQLDVSRWKPRIYFISVTDGENSEVKKVVVRP